MKPLLLLLLLTAVFLNVKITAFAIAPPSAAIIKKPVIDGHKNIATMKLKDFQQLVGRKLTFKEKIAFLVLKHKMKHHSKDADADGQLAFTLGLAGLGLLVIGLFVPYVIIGSLVAAILAIVIGGMATKEGAENKKARAGKLLGWLTLGVIALILILAVILISAFSWG